MKTAYTGQINNVQSGINPYNILNKNLTQLQEYYKNKEKTLRQYNLAPEAFNRTVAQMQDEYDQAKFKITSVQSQLDNIKRGVVRGQIDPMIGQQSMMKLVLPEETYQAMFPKQQQEETVYATGMSPASISSYEERFNKLREGMIKYPTEKKLFKWDVKKADPEEIIKRYWSERNIANLNDPRNAAKIPGFNQAFLSSMQQDERTWEVINKLLDPETGDPRMIAAFRPNSKLNKGFTNQFKSTQTVSPMAKAFEKKKELGAADVQVTPTKPTKPSSTENTNYFDMPIEELMQVNVNEGLPRILSDADYDKLPSGTQFIDPKGVKRTKP